MPENHLDSDIYTALTTFKNVSNEDVNIASKAILLGLIKRIPDEIKRRFLSELPTVDDSSFSTWLKATRNNLGMTQSELADHLRINGVPVKQSDISDLEGARKPGKFSITRKLTIRKCVERLTMDRTS